MLDASIETIVVLVVTESAWKQTCSDFWLFVFPQTQKVDRGLTSALFLPPHNFPELRGLSTT